jgi:hypothetical protein
LVQLDDDPTLANTSNTVAALNKAGRTLNCCSKIDDRSLEPVS